MRLLGKVDFIFDGILDILSWVVGSIFVAAMLIVCLDVIMRYGLNRPMAWAMEICEYILLGIACLGIAWLLREEGHVKIELVLVHLSPRVQALVNATTSILATIAVSAITWYSGQITWNLYERGVELTKVLRLPKAPMLAIVTVGMLLLFIQLLRRSYLYLTTWIALSKEQK